MKRPMLGLVIASLALRARLHLGIALDVQLPGGYEGRPLSGQISQGGWRALRARHWDGTCRGRLTAKNEANCERLVEGELEVVNQKGEATVKGAFRVAAA